MKQYFNCLAAILFTCFAATSAIAQTSSDVYGGTSDITWLGMDFTQVKFVGTATQFKDAGEISNSDFRDKYIPAWNQLFVNEPKKYNVAEATRRTEVKYAVDVTDKVNSKIKKDFFSTGSEEYRTLNESKVADLVKNYDFDGKTGIGLIFFIDGMSKGKDEVSGWPTFVNMKTKKVILTSNQTGKPGGFGFRNFWAKGFLEILKDVKADFKKNK